MGEHAGAEGEQIYETVNSAGAKRRGMSQHPVTGCPRFGASIYIYIYFLFLHQPKEGKLLYIHRLGLSD